MNWGLSHQNRVGCECGIEVEGYEGREESSRELEREKIGMR